jgi:nucleoside-diphosphate-sugar epimerase
MGTFNLLEAAGNSPAVDRFVYVSSVRYHGLLEPPPDRHIPAYLPFDENHPALLGSYYAVSKAQSEHWCRKYVRHFRKPAVAVRPTWIVTPEREPTLEADPMYDEAHLHDYIGTGDLVDGIARAMDYDPPDGFDAFLFSAVDQYSTTPTRELVDTLFPGVPTDREKLEAADGFAALIDCSHAHNVLGWYPDYRCKR